ncbi:glycosyltransferase [Butyrivibrio sp. NC3005]|uniref:glycosyltransferase n=1 Tax=Butyrivibrio sp. NC3005 TaxID=1280685 RepID=UPI0004106811|nr:glycosyltransferase [Butyrivibrio sp. NC3005]
MNKVGNIKKNKIFEKDDICAPVCLFTYKRIDSLKKVVDNLKKCSLSEKTRLYIFSDGARDESDLAEVEATRSFIHSIDGFKDIIIIERDNNIGLAENIMGGVTNVINKHKKVIVLEDDIVPNKFFLEYMNEALIRYADQQKVMEICGCSLPTDKDKAFLPQTFLLPWGGCWGWATWFDRWQYFERNPQKFVSQMTDEDIYKLDRNGTDLIWQQVLDNASGKKKTWAVFWELAIYLHNGLVLYPNVDMCKNIGFDGTGENCPIDIRFPKKKLKDQQITEFANEIKENKEAMELVMKYSKKINRPLSFWQKSYYILFIENKKTVFRNVVKKLFDIEL